jgi:hypothetical protein
MTEVLEVLTKARALVNKGWMRNGWYHIDPRTGEVDRMCAAGAIRLAAAGDNIRRLEGCHCGCGGGIPNFGPTALSLQAEQVLAQVIGVSWQSVPEWNDHNHRTKGEVLAAFDEAIKMVTPKPTYDAAACIAEAVAFGQSKVTYAIPSWVPDTVPDSFVQDVKVLVSSA